MSLSSVLATAASGISAAEFSLGVIANNLANCQTPGFKASRAAFATQMPQTQSSGAAPTAGNGGSNPVQVGTGVFVAEVSGDFSQGAIALDSSPTSLAIQGEGFFILEGSGGERLYTRDGRFGVNAEGQLVSVGGHRVLGFQADPEFRIQRTEPVPLEIPSALSVPGQDGQTATLVGFSISEDGRVRGRFSDGIARDLGQIALARFANPSGLAGQGQNVYAPGPNSGLPVASSPGEAGAGQIVAGAIELSNADIGESLVDLMLTSIQFRANLQVLLTADGLLDELMAIGRPR